MDQPSGSRARMEARIRSGWLVCCFCTKKKEKMDTQTDIGLSYDGIILIWGEDIQ